MAVLDFIVLLILIFAVIIVLLRISSAFYGVETETPDPLLTTTPDDGADRWIGERYQRYQELLADLHAAEELLEDELNRYWHNRFVFTLPPRDPAQNTIDWFGEEIQSEANRIQREGSPDSDTPFTDLAYQLLAEWYLQTNRDACRRCHTLGPDRCLRGHCRECSGSDRRRRCLRCHPATKPTPPTATEEVSYCSYCGSSSCSGGYSCPVYADFMDDDD